MLSFSPHAGRGERKRHRSRGANAPESCRRHEQKTSPLPIVVRLCRRWRPGWSRSARPTNELQVVIARSEATKQSRGGLHKALDCFASLAMTKRKRNAERRCSVTTAPSGCGAAPAGAARLPAFHHGSRLRDCSSRRLSVRPGFVGGGAVWGELPSPRRSHFQRCTSRAGHSAGRLMPEPPGSEGDEPTARRHRTRSAEPASPAGVLHGSEIRVGFVSETGTIVNGNATHYPAPR
jgi:hypothetical protein